MDQSLIEESILATGTRYHHEKRVWFDERIMIPVYARIIRAILTDQKMDDLIDTSAKLEVALRTVFMKKKVVEIGCRSGFFLAFLVDHGAIVSGTSSGNYLIKARRALGENIFDAHAESAWKTPLSSEKPDFLISVNLLDKSREHTSAELKGKLRSLYQIAKPRTAVYVLPSTDFGSIISNTVFQRLRRVKRYREIDFLRHHQHLGKDLQFDSNVLRFYVQKKRRRNVK